MTYSEKLKDPRWQKKRLEILERDEFTCSLCVRTDQTLHVHHSEYRSMPWDVPSEALTTVCEDCHKALEKIKKRVAQQLPHREIAPAVGSDGESFSGLTAYQIFSEILDRPEIASSLIRLMNFCLHHEAGAMVTEQVRFIDKIHYSGFTHGWDSGSARALNSQEISNQDTQTHTQGSETVKEVSET